MPDTFKLSDVRLAADYIVRECPPKSKEGLGGLINVGTSGFYVVVNGKEWGDSGGESGNETVSSWEEGIARAKWGGSLQVD